MSLLSMKTVKVLLRKQEKIKQKYQTLIDVLKPTFQKVIIDAVVVGGTGTWDPMNERLMLKVV